MSWNKSSNYNNMHGATIKSNPLVERHDGYDEFEVKLSEETGLTVSDLLFFVYNMSVCFKAGIVTIAFLFL